MQQPICNVQGTISASHISRASDKRLRISLPKPGNTRQVFHLLLKETRDSLCQISVIGEHLTGTDVQILKWTHNCEKFEKWAMLVDCCSPIQNQIWLEALTYIL